MMRIGAHVGIGDGWEEAARYCREVGCECVQVFSRSPRLWRATKLPDDDVAAFNEVLAANGIGPVFIHTSYLINLGSDDDALWERSIDSLAEELRRASVVGASLVTHVGTDSYGDASLARARIASAIGRARAAASPESAHVSLLLENAAGQGRSYGGQLSDLGALVCAAEDAGGGPAGACLDTCHAFAFGYSFSSPEHWETALDEIEEACGTGRVRLIHANDCKFGQGEKKDRHEWIGEGLMGEESFASMFGISRLQQVPVIVEMPGEAPIKDSENITRLKTLRGATARA